MLRAYLMGYMICFGFAGGGLAMLMLQYVSRRQVGAAAAASAGGDDAHAARWSRLMFVPIIFLMKHLYQWAAFPNAAGDGTVRWRITGSDARSRQLTANAKHAMLSPTSAMVQTVIIFGVL